jgi:hypothetical protein
MQIEREGVVSLSVKVLAVVACAILCGIAVEMEIHYSIYGMYRIPLFPGTSHMILENVFSSLCLMGVMVLLAKIIQSFKLDKHVKSSCFSALVIAVVLLFSWMHIWASDGKMIQTGGTNMLPLLAAEIILRAFVLMVTGLVLTQTFHRKPTEKTAESPKQESGVAEM